MSYPISSELEIEGTGAAPGKATLSNGTNAITMQASTSLAASYTMLLPTTLGAVGESLTMTSATETGWASVGPPAGSGDIWFISDIKSTGTQGGSLTAGTWNNRVLNTISSTPGASTDVQLAVAPAGTNEILIQPGNYFIYGVVLSYRTDQCKAALWNVTAGNYAILGNSASVRSVNIPSYIIGPITFGIQTVLSVRIWPTSTPTVADNGRAMGIAPFSEMYTKVYIQKI